MAKETKNENVEVSTETVSKTEIFFNKYRNSLLITLCVLVVIGVAYFCWYKFAFLPKQAEAFKQMTYAEANFRNMEYDLALNGDGNVLGFAEIVDEYGCKAGKSVYMYAGVCELQLGNYEAAINYLKKYKGKDNILAGRALACIGDAYVGLGDYSTAVAYFKKAAEKSDDVFSAAYLLKAGVASEELGNDAQALAFYKEIKDKYPQSMEGYDVDKYISRIEAK